MDASFVDKIDCDIFESIWDVAIVGAGYAGFAAAQAAEEAGKSVLLVDSRCDLLWESARARNPELGKSSEEFRDFTLNAARITGIAEDWIDPGSAEWIANEMLMESKIKRLYFASPLSVEIDSQKKLSSVIFAIREGIVRIAAKQWIDATETGIVARLCDSSIKASLPSRRIARIFLQRTRWQMATPIEIDSGIQGVKASLEDSQWASEKIIKLELDNTYTRPYARVFTPVLKALRAKLGTEYNDAFVSHWSYDPFPVYPRTRKAVECQISNLALAAPALASGTFATLAERYSLGTAAFEHLADIDECQITEKIFAKSVKMPKPVKTISADVFVAGLGTGGTIAAIAAGRRGMNVIAADPQSFPGGVATAAGINAYYYGCPGGLQSEIDDAVEKLMPLYTAKVNIASGFHPLARRVVNEDMLNAVGVNQLYGSSFVYMSTKQNRGKVISLLLATEDGCIEVRAKTWIDATGEGDLCCSAGAAGYEGRSGDGFFNAYTQSWGVFSYRNFGLQSHISNIDCGYVQPDYSIDMTTARINGIHYLVENSHVKTSNTYNRTTGVMPNIGIRAGRLIVTQYTMTLEDMVERRRFPDAVGYTGGHIDNHSHDLFFECADEAFYNWTAKGWHFPTACEIPYRAILPAGLTNVWLACRAAGCDEVTCNAFRMQRDIQRIGEVAGIAASLAVSCKATNSKVPYDKLRDALVASGALRPLSEQRVLYGCASTEFDGDPVLTASATDDNVAKWLKMLSNDKPGLALWRIYSIGPSDLDKWRYTRKGTPALRKKLLSLLRSKNKFEKWHSALILGAWGCREAVPRLLEAVAKREFPETGWRAVNGYTTAAWTLGFCGDRKTYPILAELATDTSVDRITRMTAIWSCEQIALGERNHTKADVKLLEKMMSATRDIVEPLRPWERALCTESLRKALGLKPDPTDYEAQTSSPLLLVRNAYAAIICSN